MRIDGEHVDIMLNVAAEDQGNFVKDVIEVDDLDGFFIGMPVVPQAVPVQDDDQEQIADAEADPGAIASAATILAIAAAQEVRPDVNENIELANALVFFQYMKNYMKKCLGLEPCTSLGTHSHYK
jgi:hypothetical protein